MSPYKNIYIDTGGRTSGTAKNPGRKRPVPMSHRLY